MNWDDKSDTEINKKLTQIVKGYSDSFMRRNSGVYFDYCNSWADIGPLMLKFDVYILPTSNDCEFNYLAKTLIDGSIGMGWTTKYTSFNNNPLRAAATCLIKKLEAENESILTTG